MKFTNIGEKLDINHMILASGNSKYLYLEISKFKGSFRKIESFLKSLSAKFLFHFIFCSQEGTSYNFPQNFLLDTNILEAHFQCTKTVHQYHLQHCKNDFVRNLI